MGSFEGIESLQVCSGQHGSDKHFTRAFVLPIDLYEVRFGQVTIQNENCHFPILRIHGACYVYIWHLAQARHLIRWGFHQQIEDRAARILKPPVIGIVDGLAKQAVRIGHDWRDDID